jgi:mono/diheme cytochrome c family protein
VNYRATHLAISVALSSLGLAACAPGTGGSAASSPSPTMATEARPMMVMTPPALANGRAIFMTGRDLAGVAIGAKIAPLKPSCAACHRTDGSGGVKLPGGATSADLRHKALVTAQHRPYTLALLERAISTGIDNEGKPLDPVMPRWTMSRDDLRSVASFVLTQLK